MKSLLNKLKSLFAIMLVFPLMFIFSACGKKDKNNGNTNSPSGGIEQPEGETPGGSGGSGEGGSGDSGQDTPVPEVQNFSVSIDYNLPEYLADLKIDETKTAVVSTGYTLPTFVGTEYENYFSGWKYDDGETVENGVVYGTKDSTVSVKAVWDENKLKQLFYTAGLEFSFSTYDDQYLAKVSNYTGNNSIVVLPQYVIHDGSVYSVSGVGASAFKDNQVVKEVRTYLIDFSVSNSSFENSTLEELEFDKVSSIGNSAFKNSNVKSAIFSDYLTSVSASMFENCTELTTVKFSAPANVVIGLKKLPNYAFKGCTKLSLIDLHTSTDEIGVETFKDCSSISSFDFIKISSVTKLSNSAFANCVSLENIEIPEPIVSYGTQIFEGCLIKQIKVPTAALGVTEFSARFGDLSSTLEKIEFIGSNSSVISTRYLEDYAKLTHVVMGEYNISAIQEYAFSGCFNLGNITFSKAIVGDNFNLTAFYGTKWFNEIENKLENNSLIINNTLLYVSPAADSDYILPQSVKYINKGVFTLRETNVTSISIHKNVEYINKDAFVGSKITAISLANDNANYCLSAHDLKDDKLVSIGTGHTLYRVENSKADELIAYFSTVSGGIIVVDENVKTINDSAFDLENAPDKVYVAQKVYVELNGLKKVDYIFENAESTTSSTNNNVYKILSDEYYTIDDDGITPIITDVEEVKRLGNYHLIVINFEESEGPDVGVVTKFYYLITIDGNDCTPKLIDLPSQD